MSGREKDTSSTIESSLLKKSPPWKGDSVAAELNPPVFLVFNTGAYTSDFTLYALSFFTGEEFFFLIAFLCRGY